MLLGSNVYRSELMLKMCRYPQSYIPSADVRQESVQEHLLRRRWREERRQQ